MGSLLKSTDNTRTILPDSYRFIRSDVPYRIIPEEVDWLIGKNVRTIIDLRSESEQKRKPCFLATDSRFIYLHLPVTGGDSIPALPEDVADSYIHMVDDQMQEIIASILNAATNVLYFCNAGKDRTGVVSAILLKNFGISNEEIIRDYELSGANLKNRLEAFTKENPTIDINVITPKKEYMERFLKWYDEHR